MIKKQTKFKETVIGPIPEEWSLFKVDSLVKNEILEKPIDGNHGGIHPKNSDYTNSGVPFVMASDLENGQINFNNCKFISENTANNLQKGFSKPGDVLISHKATIGRTALVNDKYPRIVLTPQVTYYRVKDYSKLNNRYLKYYFDSFVFQNLLNQWAGSGSTRSYLGITNQLELPIILPKINEQKQIAEILSSLDDKIELNRKINTNLEKLASSLFKQWFVDFEFPNENQKPYKTSGGKMIDSELGEIPEGWKVGTIGSFAKIRSGFAFKGEDFNDTSGVPVIKIKNIIEPNIDLDNLNYVSEEIVNNRAKEFVLEAGDILIAMSGNTTGKIGIMPKTSNKYVLNQRVGKYFFKDRINLGYIYFYLRSGCVQGDIIQSAYGSAQPNISPSILENVKILAPIPNLLKMFNEITNEIINISINNISEIRLLSKQRDSLLPQLMSGKIRVK